MHKPLLTALVTVHLLALAPAQRQGGRGDSRPAQKLENFTVEELKFASGSLRRGEAHCRIYLPKGYGDEANKDKKYPWFVWLPGFGGYSRFADSGGAEVVDKLRGEGKIPPLVVVLFEAPARTTIYLNGEASGDTEDLIVKDLVAQVQGKYRVLDDPAHRALMGESMGGMAALKIAMHHPEVFGTVAAHSAAILPADPADIPKRYERQLQMMMGNGLEEVFGNPINKDKWALEMPLGLVAKKKPEDLKGLKIYFDAGTDDRYGFGPPNGELDKAMTAKGIPHVFRMVEGGGHAWASPSMRENMLHSVQFVGAVFAGKDPVKDAAKDPKEKKEPGEEKKGAGEKPKEGGSGDAKKEGATGR